MNARRKDTFHLVASIEINRDLSTRGYAVNTASVKRNIYVQGYMTSQTASMAVQEGSIRKVTENERDRPLALLASYRIGSPLQWTPCCCCNHSHGLQTFFWPFLYNAKYKIRSLLR